MEDIIKDRVLIRSFVLDSLDYLIEESVYYRYFSDQIKNSQRYVLFTSGNEEGSCKLP
jgi:hypothetical protein